MEICINIMDIPITDPDKIWELRLYLGDLGDPEMGDQGILSDEAYQYFINKATNPETKEYYFRKALMGAAMSILATLTKGGARQRIGQEEIYGKELVDSWLLFLKELKKPSSRGVTPTVYIGGTVRDATAYYATSMEFIDPPFYRGQQDRSPYWENKRQEFLDFVKEPEELKHRGLFFGGTY